MRGDWGDPRAVALRDEMEAEMDDLYGPSMSEVAAETLAILDTGFTVQPGTIVATVFALDGDDLVGQAGIRPHSPEGTFEVKKVMVDAGSRGLGISRRLMLQLEVAAKELGATSLILQTGSLQVAAIALYESLGYVRTAPYPPYEVMDSMLCYAKPLSD